jgi:hypothetical protein
MELLIDNPIIIPKTKNLLKIPYQDKKHPLQERLVLIACLVSGNNEASGSGFQAQIFLI